MKRWRDLAFYMIATFIAAFIIARFRTLHILPPTACAVLDLTLAAAGVFLLPESLRPRPTR